jgi:hypothetical protein
MTENEKNKIREWLLSDMNREKGLAIFCQICRGKPIARGAHLFDRKKLEYQMKLLYGIDPVKLFNQKCSNQQLINEHEENKKTAGQVPAAERQMGAAQNRPAERRPAPAEKTAVGEKVPADQHIILQAKTAIADLSVEIAKLHNDLWDTGVENDKKTVAKRRRILDKRLALIRRKEEIYQLKEKYFQTGEISPMLTELLTEDNDTGSSPKQPEKMTDMELVKELKNAKTNHRKNLNMLQYQSPNKQDSPNPMPEGLRRKETTKRAQFYASRAAAIEKEINKRTKNNK